MPPHIASHAIELHSLSKTYNRRGKAPVHAVIDLNVTVPAGQVLGLLGANGAGKTTTIKMMCGLVQPTRGRVLLSGIDVFAHRGQAMQQLGAVLEGTRNVYWRLSALQNLRYFGRLKGCWGRQLTQRAEHLLRQLDLWERRHDPVNSFSRGMQQKVALACALIADPPVVLLDEPTLGLDVHAARTVKLWIQTLSRQGKTVVLTTHQLNMAEELCERVVIMRQGQLIADAPTARLLDRFRPERYQVCVAGHVEASQLCMPTPLSHTVSVAYNNGHTILTCHLAHQNMLYQLLSVVQELRLPLLAVERTEATLEEVFVRLTTADTKERIT